MLKKLIEDINNKKIAQTPYFSDILEIEKNLDLLTIYDQVQAYSFLQIEYFISDDIEKCKFYIEKTKLSLTLCIEKNILDKDDIIHFGLLLSDAVINEIRIKKDYLLLKTLRSDQIYTILEYNCFKLFVFIIELFLENKNVDLILISFDYVRSEEAWKLLFNIYAENIDFFEMNNIDFENINDNCPIKYYFLLYMNNHQKWFDVVINDVIDKQNEFSNLEIIVSNTIKTEKYELFVKLIERLFIIVGKENSYLNHYALIAMKLHEKTQIHDLLVKNKRIKDQYIDFLLFKKNYKQILSIDIENDVKFFCLLKLGLIEEAKLLYSKYIDKKYVIDDLDRSNKNTEITKRGLILFFLKTQDTTSLLNLLQNIDQSLLFTKVLKKAYKYGVLNIILEGIKIGINRFGSRNSQLVKIFISFLHIQEIKITILERVATLLLIIEQLTFENIALIDKKWIYDVIYNNCIDCIENKLDLLWDLIKILLKIEEINLEIIELILMGKKRLIYLQKDEYNIHDLLNFYISLNSRNINLTLLFFEQIHDIRIINLFKPYSKLSNSIILKMLCMNTEYFEMKIELYKLAEKRNILTDDILNRFASIIAIYGSAVMIEVFEEINIKKRFTKHIEGLIIQQIELVKFTNSKTLKARLLRLLDNSCHE